MSVSYKEQCKWVRDDGPGRTKSCMLRDGHVGAHVDHDAEHHRWMHSSEWRKYDDERSALIKQRDRIIAERDALNDMLRRVIKALEGAK